MTAARLHSGLKWKTLQHGQHVTASPSRIGLIARAAFVLVLFEHRMIT